MSYLDISHIAANGTMRWVQDMTLNFDPARICEYPLATPTEGAPHG